MSEKMDYMEFFKKYSEENGISLDDDDINSAAQTMKNIQVLRFRKNPQKAGVISDYNNGMVFPDQSQLSKQLKEGDVFICSLSWTSNGYCTARPLIKLDASTLLSLDEDLRDRIAEGLMDSNREYYEKMFADSMSEKLSAAIRDELSGEYEEKFRIQEERIRNLKVELDRSNRIISESKCKEVASTDDWIELTSESETEPSAPVCVTQGHQTFAQGVVPVDRLSYRPHASAPGLPSVRRTDSISPVYGNAEYRVVRVGECRIKCSAFTNGKYFVHISPSGKYMVIRPHEYGEVSCVNNIMTIDRLDELLPVANDPFEESDFERAEYNARYDGMIIYLE